MRHWSRRLTRLAFLLAFVAAALAPLAFARAGGGGHYSGGGHSSSSHYSSGGGHYSGGHYSSGGDGLGQLVILLVQLIIYHPIAGIPLTFMLMYCAYVIYNSSDTMLVSSDRMHDTIARASEVQDQVRLQAMFSKIRERDPDFLPEAFLQRAGQAFLKVQEAWSAQDMAPARAFISDGVAERFGVQLEMQKADGKRNVMENVTVQEASIVEVESDRFFDTLHVRIAASAVDKEVSLSDGTLLFGSDEPESFVEIWSFVRRPGAKTLKKPGLLEGFCPSCGAPLALADAAQCQTCKSWVNSAEFDWVLCEITQEEEWSVRGCGEGVPGFRALAEKDPALSTQFIEDRASVAFWRWQAALSQKNPALMRSVATDDFCAKLEARGSYYRDAGVGAVEVQAFETGGEQDRAHVLVKWAGDWYDASGGEPQDKGHVLRQHVVILGRKAGVQTDARAGLRSARCGACGAPPARRDQARCEYCGTAFNDGSRQWTVVDIAAIGFWKRPEAGAPGPAIDADWARELAPVDSLALLVAAMSSDGEIDAREQALAEAFARSRSIRPETAAAMISSAKQGQIFLPKPENASQARACLRGLAQMSLADGRVSEEEIKLMTAFGAPFGFNEGDVWAVVKEERTALFRQAKADLKASSSAT